MAKYKLCRGVRYGEIIHLPNTPEVALAVTLGDLELVPDEPTPAVKEPTWGLVPTANGADVCILLTLPSGEQQRYAGPVKGAKDGFKRRVWSGEAQDYVQAGPEPPTNVLADYAARKGQQEREAAAMAAGRERATRDEMERKAANTSAAAAALARGN